MLHIEVKLSISGQDLRNLIFKKCLQYCVILIKSIFTLQVLAANAPLKTFAVFSHSFIAVDDTTAVQELSPDDLGVLLLQIMM